LKPHLARKQRYLARTSLGDLSWLNLLQVKRSRTVSFEIVDDEAESDETFTVVVVDIDGAVEGRTGTVTIMD